MEKQPAEKRGAENKQFKIMELNKEVLTDLYITYRLSTSQIANKLNCRKSHIQKALHKFEIKTRTVSEARKGMKFSKQHRINISITMQNMNKGENNPNWKGHFIKYCLTCNKEFEVCLSEHEQGLDKYCSHKCYAESLKGKHFSPSTEFKKGIASWLKNKHIQTNTGRTHFKKGKSGNPATQFKKGDTSYWKGKKNPHFTGENNPKWKGGVTPEHKKVRWSQKYKDFREEIFKRDKYTCKDCKRKRKPGDRVILNVHHIKPFAKYEKLRFVKSNVVTLCKECHKKRH